MQCYSISSSFEFIHTFCSCTLQNDNYRLTNRLFHGEWTFSCWTLDQRYTYSIFLRTMHEKRCHDNLFLITGFYEARLFIFVLSFGILLSFCLSFPEGYEMRYLRNCILGNTIIFLHFVLYCWDYYACFTKLIFCIVLDYLIVFNCLLLTS